MAGFCKDWLKLEPLCGFEDPPIRYVRTHTDEFVLE
jgi:hypothetical protein